jgi:hypothetical protein
MKTAANPTQQTKKTSSIPTNFVARMNEREAAAKSAKNDATMAKMGLTQKNSDGTYSRPKAASGAAAGAKAGAAAGAKAGPKAVSGAAAGAKAGAKAGSSASQDARAASKGFTVKNSDGTYSRPKSKR